MEDVQSRLMTILAQEQSRRQVEGEPGRITAVRETDAAGEALSGYSYNAQGDLAEIVEPDGRRRRYQYDERRRLVRSEGPGGVSVFAYQDNRLAALESGGVACRFQYDAAGRLARLERGAEHALFRYDEQGRPLLARTAEVTTEWTYTGSSTTLTQSFQGLSLSLELAYDAQGRLERLRLPGLEQPLEYNWDEQNRPAALRLGGTELARYTFDDAHRATRLDYAGGLVSELESNRPDGRAVRFSARLGAQTLLEQRYAYGAAGEVLSDGSRQYIYDLQGRLAQAEGPDGRWDYTYDALDNRLSAAHNGQATAYTYTNGDALQSASSAAGCQDFFYDAQGRLAGQSGAGGEWTYRYDDAGCLRQVRLRGELRAAFTYDHKGRLVFARRLTPAGERAERYLYGPADELLAVLDAQGRPLRLLARTPLGLVAEILPRPGAGPQIIYRLDDPLGRARLWVGQDGDLISRCDYDPFGLPVGTGYSSIGAAFNSAGALIGSAGADQSLSDAGEASFAGLTGREWFAETGLYWFGARWYSPSLGRFITPDSYTGAPDDERLVNPYRPGAAAGLAQADARAQILNEWLKQPRVRSRYTFCANDPIGHVDPNGHWSFGGVLLTLLGAIWTLPNTLFGLLIEITCLVGEVVRWLVWLVSFGNVSWETPGFDAAASGNLNAFALVFSGGWLGSFSSLLGITFGNVFFVYKDWENSNLIKNLPDPVFPAAYDGKVSIPRSHVLYEHELRHTNQYGWLGPFFHLGMPIFGFYEWDVILHGYENAWTERDAREHSEPAPGGAAGSGAPGSTPGTGTPGAPGAGAPATPPLPTTGAPGAPGTPGATPSTFTVEAHTQTRAGGVPLAGVKVQVSSPAGVVDLGASNGQGGFSQSPSVSGAAFTVSAVFENPAEHLKKEELNLVFSGVNPASGAFQCAVSNQILKVRQVAGAGSQDFTQSYSLDPASTTGEVSYSAADHKFIINLRLATFSLDVPYFNQNSQSDTVSTIPGFDPEPSSHEVLPRFTGGILCFPSSVHMLLKYWGSSKTRAQVMQQNYLEWAKDGFPERLDRSSTTRAAAAPASPALNARWQDTSSLTSAGYPLRKWNGSAWVDIADADWRIQKGQYKVWTLYAYQHKAIDAFKPEGTQFNDKIDDATQLADLPDDIFTAEFKPHFRDKLAQGLPIVIGTSATAGHIMVLRGMVVDKDQNVAWFICNDPFGNLSAAGSIYAPLGLGQSVGLGGSNQEADVRRVQEVLRACQCYLGEVNGACDGTAADPTVAGIKKFQKTKMGQAAPDSLVQPGGATETALDALDFSSYTSAEGENNSSAASGEDGTRGKHVYYNETTQGVNHHLEIKGLWRGVVMLTKTTPFAPAEIAARLTPGA